MFAQFFIVFFISSFFSSEDIQTVIIHMPGNADGGFNFLNPKFDLLNKQNRSSMPLNPTKIYSQTDGFEKKTFIYTNNLPINDMDLGGPACVSFYEGMILDANTKYPNAEIILVGASQGSVGPFGALAQLAQKNHPVVVKIKKVLIQAALGSAHETINFHVKKIPVLKMLPYLSKKIAPLLAEYLPPSMLGFGAYDAFAPQMYYYIETITQNSELLKHINYYIMHGLYDDIIPYVCAQNAHSLLPKNQAHIKITTENNHLPAQYHQKKILKFLTCEQPQKTKSQKTKSQKIRLPLIDNWHLKTPLERFCIRRMRDFTLLATLFISCQSIKYIIGSIVKILKNRY